MSSDKEGRFVAVAGRDGGGLTIFERDSEKGLTLEKVARLEVDKVVCPLWID
jgi:6-phosphogluconolactonase (cycloisomerase 2 family)